MERYILIFTLLLIAGCTSRNASPKQIPSGTDTMPAEASDIRKQDTKTDMVSKNEEIAQNSVVYQNARFKEVTVTRMGENTFEIKGKAQIFEASFSWIIEDGHEELQKGFATTDAGAPEWGNFSFTVTASKKRPGSTLHLILFETSAKDGSRQHELPLLLY